MSGADLTDMDSLKLAAHNDKYIMYIDCDPWYVFETTVYIVFAKRIHRPTKI